ncbi:MAG: hypothetical protein NTV23_03285 [Propionibacteriales bacterium]|nr:hypothetical protein [Propionibacteriales bacterium]
MATPRSDDEHRLAAEDWFASRGLPYFVDHVRSEVRTSLARPRLLALAAVSVVFAAAAFLAVWFWSEDPSNSILAAMVSSGVPLAVYASRALHAGTVARWTIGRTLSSLGLLVPLVTRALPLLLLFVTFLFINTEVWQVASSLDDGVLWVSVLLFALVAVAFLLVRLPEELDQVDDEMTGERLKAACAGTPLEDEAARCADETDDAVLVACAQVTGLAKANLVLVLLVSQALQVLLLSLAMFLFFVVFGMVSIRDDVVRAWVGHDPSPFVDAVPLFTHELARVSTFLAAFSGLYFTVYAVSDDSYRKQFFGSLMTQLRRAVGVRTVYRVLASPSP